MYMNALKIILFLCLIIYWREIIINIISVYHKINYNHD